VSDLSKRVETDVSVFRLRLAPVADGSVVFGWDYPGSTLLRVRILRTAAVPVLERSVAAAPAPSDAVATPPEPDARAPWQLVYDADTGSFRDRGVEPGRTYRYAVFARNGTGPWTLWRDEVVEVPVAGTF
jgi:hypothetical protein